MERWNIKGVCLEYDDDSHTYLADGIIVPSVTQLMKVEFGNKYIKAKPNDLKKAAERGTAVHKAIEKWCTEGAEDKSKELRNFKFLMKFHRFEVVDNEVPILIFQEGAPIAAGRLDLVLNMYLDIPALADIKTTSVLDKDYLGYQLNLYRIGYQQCYDKDIKELYGIHLRDNTRKLVHIPINEDYAWNIVKKYKEKEEI